MSNAYHDDNNAAPASPVQNDNHNNGYPANNQVNGNKMGGGYADNLSNGVNNMHVSQNPSISSPPLGPTRSGFGASLSSAPSTASSGKVSPQVIEESLSDPQLQGHPSTWSIDQVAYWLRWIGYDNVVGSFVGKSRHPGLTFSAQGKRAEYSPHRLTRSSS
jgi:hypothetical protein